MNQSRPARFRGLPDGSSKRRRTGSFDCGRAAGKPTRRSRSRASTEESSKIALRYRGDAFRVIYAVQIGAELWIIHAFKKKSKTGIKTPQMEVDLFRERLKRLKQAFK